MSQLSEFLESVSAPINYISKLPPATAQRASFPAAELAERAATLAKECSAPAQVAALVKLSGALKDCEESDEPGDRLEALRRCRVLLDELREDNRSLATYQRRTGNLKEDLESLSQSIQFVPGVGPRRAEILRKMGLVTVEDLLYHLPFRYEDRRNMTTIRQAQVGETVSLRGEIIHLSERHVGRGRRKILEGAVRDESGLLGLTWYHQIGYFSSRYKTGQRCIVHGKIEGVGQQKRIVHPEIHAESELESQAIVPVYNKPTSMTVGAIRKIVHQGLANWGERLPSVLPEELTTKAGITDLGQAMRRIHLPHRDEDVSALNDFDSAAHRSLVFDELFFFNSGWPCDA